MRFDDTNNKLALSASFSVRLKKILEAHKVLIDQIDFLLKLKKKLGHFEWNRLQKTTQKHLKQKKYNKNIYILQSVLIFLSTLRVL